MKISSLSSQGVYQPDLSQTPRGQRAQAFRALGNALQSGDLAGAQTAFATLQQRSTAQSTQQTGSGQTQTGQGNTVGNDFASLASALQSGDLTAAQQAFASLQQDLQKAHHGHHHHHHHEQEGEDGGRWGKNNQITINITINETPTTTGTTPAPTTTTPANTTQTPPATEPQPSEPAPVVTTTTPAPSAAPEVGTTLNQLA